MGGLTIMNPIDIGVATLIYDKNNHIENAFFKPTLELKDCDKLVDELKKNPHTENVVHHAEHVFASWFNKMNEIELADREEYQIKHYVMPLLSPPLEDGKTEVAIRFVFEKIS